MSGTLQLKFCRTLLVGLFCSPALALCPVQPGNITSRASDTEIKKWIDDLGDSHFETREAATRALMEREEAAPALAKALNSPDLEVRRRATAILVELKAKRSRRAIAHAHLLAKEGRIVEMVDRLVYWREWKRADEGWAALTQFAEKAMDSAGRDVYSRGHQRGWKGPILPAGEFRRYVDSRPAEVFSGSELLIPFAGRVLIRGERVTVEGESNPGLHTGIVAVSGNASIDKASYSLIVAGGNVKIGSFDDSILVCDGDVELSEPPREGLIIARGKVSCRRGKLLGTLIRSEDFYQVLDGKKIIIKEGTPDPVGFVKFFELDHVGLTASDRDKKDDLVRNGVYIKDIRRRSLFASKLQVGDVVMAIEEKRVTSIEQFRQLLRSQFAKESPDITFTIRRAGKTVDVPIAIKD